VFPKKDEPKVTPIRPAETDAETGLTPADSYQEPTTALPAKATDLLTLARDLVGGDRALQHGDKHETTLLTSRLWTAYLGVQVTPVEVAQCLALLKVARSKSGSHNLDNYVDHAGYAAIAGELAEGRG
jgi:hypothetical protein